VPGPCPARIIFSGMVLSLLLLPALPLHAAESPRPKTTAADCRAHQIEARIQDVSALGDINLDTGIHVHLADILLPESGPLRDQALRLIRDMTGEAVSVSHARKKDRWGRYRAAVRLNGQDITGQLVKQGLAVIDTGEAASLCNHHLSALEQQAREQASGLWALDSYKPVPASDTQRLLERKGRFTIVTGRVRSVGEREKRTYLNFGKDWKNDFTVTISSKVWSDMVKSGVSASRLTGREVSVRGVIRQWNGPALDILSADMIMLTGGV